MITVAEVANRLSVSTRTVQRWIDEGKLLAYQFGREYRINEKDFEAFMERSKTIKDDIE